MQTSSLPERLEDLLPAEAEAVDAAGRAILSWLTGHGYRLAIPPLAEGLSSLLGNGLADSGLAARTLRLTDPLGGSPIGIRADITPQVMRIDRQRLAGGIQRLCYCGPTIYARPVNPWNSREQLQAGAELFGAEREAGDREILMLATGALANCGLADMAAALGHAGIIDALLDQEDPQLRSAARAALGKRDTIALDELAPQLSVLAHLHGGRSALDRARADLPAASCGQFVAELERAADLLDAAGIEWGLDLAGLAGYEYHNGLAFAVLSGERIVARGGRYDRPDRTAIGFTADARSFADLQPERKPAAIVATVPAWEDAAWRKAAAELVAAGKVLRMLAAGESMPADCKAQLVRTDDGWQEASSE